MKIGFTGSRDGMNDRQKEQLYTFMQNAMIVEFHHGDCVGADEEAHLIAIDSASNRRHEPALIYVHPPVLNKWRAYCKGYDGIYPPVPYLMRNKRIVDRTDLLIAAPKTMKETTRSGTWATVRYAKKQKKPILFLVP